MVSRLVSHVQLISTELALKAIEKQQQVAQEYPEPAALITSQDPHVSLPVTTTDAPALPETRGTLSLVPQVGNCEAEADSAVVTFMETLKAWLAELAVDPASALQGKAMSQALTSGVLKVFDPIDGVVIPAWDVAAIRPRQNQSERIDAIGWSEFLKQRVKRADGFSYAKDPDGSYLDAMTGESAFFGAVGSKFHYFTWPRIDIET
ncbi:hypothetical protein [Agrobacterium bohemicum]|uniref:Uncharacterized protein n=1 Tax=Agrobacterium bohemicum TaxID=2052828 RepID=A0A135P5W5_9HYPH|nr:hypothetical protein [Agrobacterium bohemicum]KXG86827.1 hypothetical protein ATO67_02120 [Agrobacterium bohemicum]